MEWLVRIDVTPVGELLDRAVRAGHVAEEQAHVKVAFARGDLLRLWRVPGAWASWSIWRAPDATALHDLLSALPLWPWMSVEVHPLGTHPLDPN